MKKPQYHKFDLPSNITLKGDLAIDTEAMGLNNHRDRLCVVQLSDETGAIHVVHYPEAKYDSPNLIKFLSDPARQMIFHFARFDVAIIHHYLKVDFTNVFCTKIASRLTRTYSDQHGLKDLCAELIGAKLNKQQQSSDWGAAELTPAQVEYAAGDVLYLHELRNKLQALLQRAGRLDLANECFGFLPTRCKLDLLGWGDFDIFQH
ncbi:MAG: ribonuclease D [Rickettsiales bacterium]